MICVTFSKPAELSSTALAITLRPALIETFVHRGRVLRLREQPLTPRVDDGVEVGGSAVSVISPIAAASVPVIASPLRR